MRRWKLTIEYDGTEFSGWQRQAEVLTVQQVIEEAIEKFSGEKVVIHGSGRTDAGVHARANAAHFDLAKDITADKIRDALNFYVRPHRIAILQVDQVADDFHARFNAGDRSYRYFIVNRRAELALELGRAWHIHRNLDIGVMQQAADMLLGKHDFSTFRAQGCQANSPIRTLDILRITREDELVTIYAKARSFLYHQVRNMVGTLVMVGSGQWSLDEFAAAFAACDRTKGGPTAPPQGLVFWEVNYPQK